MARFRNIVIEDDVENELRITPEGRLPATREPVLPVSGTNNRVRSYVVALGSTGANSGVTDAQVDGSIIPQTFFVGAHADADLFIKTVTLVISDAGNTTAEFGSIAELGAGFDLRLQEGPTPNFNYLAEKAKTNGHLLAWSRGVNALATSGNEIVNWNAAGNDVNLFTFDLSYLPDGFRIGRGTTNRVEAIINDNLGGLNGFWLIASGFAVLDFGNEAASFDPGTFGGFL